MNDADDLPELPPAFITMRRIRQCEDEVAAQLALEHYALAYGAACFRAGMERAAVIASAHSTEPLHPDVPFADQDEQVTHIAHWQAQNIAAAIRAAK
jgi:hypothetical protein